MDLKLAEMRKRISHRNPNDKEQDMIASKRWMRESIFDGDEMHVPLKPIDEAGDFFASRTDDARSTDIEKPRFRRPRFSGPVLVVRFHDSPIRTFQSGHLYSALLEPTEAVGQLLEHDFEFGASLFRGDIELFESMFPSSDRFAINILLLIFGFESPVVVLYSARVWSNIEFREESLSSESRRLYEGRR